MPSISTSVAFENKEREVIIHRKILKQARLILPLLIYHSEKMMTQPHKIIMTIIKMSLFYLVIVVVIIIICAGTLVKEMIRSFRKKNAVFLVKKNEEIKYYICIILYKYVLVLLKNIWLLSMVK